LKASTDRNNIAINLRFLKSRDFTLHVNKSGGNRRHAKWASLMAPSWAAERELAPAPDPASIRTIDRRERRRGVHPVAEAAQSRRTTLDSLAIGAPLTAAFVGALLIEPGTAARPAHDPDAAVSAARGTAAGDLAPSVDGAHGTPAAAPELAATTAAAVADPSEPILDPVSVAGVGPAVVVPHETGAAGYAGAVASDAVAPPAPAAVAGGLSVSLMIAGMPGAEPIGVPGIDGAHEGGTIGKYVTGTPGDDVIHGTMT
jgi:hypothetical protein